MIELLMVVCAAVSPFNCKEQHLGPYFEPGLTVMVCAMKGQKEIAKWTRTHPGWKIRRYRCARVGIYAKA